MFNKSAHERLIDDAARELDNIIKLPADEFSSFVQTLDLSQLANMRNMISMRMLAMIRTKEQLMAVLKQLPEDDSDISEFVTTIRDLFEQLVFHEDKTVLCNLELVRRGVDLTHPE